MNSRAQIIQIIRKVSGKDITPELEESLFESGVLDSFALPDMVSALEREFAISIPDSDLSPRKFDSVSRIEAYLETRRN